MKLLATIDQHILAYWNTAPQRTGMGLSGDIRATGRPAMFHHHRIYWRYVNEIRPGRTTIIKAAATWG